MAKRRGRRTLTKRTTKRRRSKAKSYKARSANARGKKTARRSTGAKRAAKSSSRKATKTTARQSINQFTTERRREIFGAVLIALGLITATAAITSGTGFSGSIWLRILAQVFGWGALFFPLLVIGIGLMLVWRNLPTGLDLEGYIGLSILLLVALAGIHALLGGGNAEQGLAIAREGRGGGLLGASILSLLVGAFGGAGAAVAFAALLIVAVSLTLGISVSEMFTGAVPGISRLRERFNLYPRRRTRRAPRAHVAPSEQSETPAVAIGIPASPRTGQGWTLPSLDDLLERGSIGRADDELDGKRAALIEDTLRLFGAPSKIVAINRGPTITQFGVEPEYLETRRGRRTKVKVSKVSALADDLALALASPSIRIEAPVPGKGFIGIEVPNQEISLVALRDVMTSKSFQSINSNLRLAIGQDVSGRAIAADLASMPHLLIAGTTGSGKSVCVNALVSCLLLQNTPAELKLLMIDPKRVELTSYNGIPHLLVPVIVDLERVVPALQWISREMDRRYSKFSKEGVRNIADFNDRMITVHQDTMPTIAVVIDELADLMMMAPDETERVVTRLAQLARATGIHLIIATQRPSVDVVTGIIKANFSARIAFAVASSVDSRVIIDQPGAERLLGKGDMLYQAPDASAPVRMQGSFVSEAELSRLVGYWKFAEASELDTSIPESAELKQAPLWEEVTEASPEQDELFNEAVEVLRQMRRGSISLLQRRLRIGYTRAARLIDQLEEAGIVGPAVGGSAAREVLDYGDPTAIPSTNAGGEGADHAPAPSAVPPADRSSSHDPVPHGKPPLASASHGKPSGKAQGRPRDKPRDKSSRGKHQDKQDRRDEGRDGRQDTDRDFSSPEAAPQT